MQEFFSHLPVLLKTSGEASVLILLVLAADFAAHADLIIYTNSLQNGWQNWSWATVNLANTSQSHSAPNSISVTANNSSSDWQAKWITVQ